MEEALNNPVAEVIETPEAAVEAPVEIMPEVAVAEEATEEVAVDETLA